MKITRRITGCKSQHIWMFLYVFANEDYRLLKGTTHLNWRVTRKLCHISVTRGTKSSVSRDLFKIFGFYKMFWIANNTYDSGVDKGNSFMFFTQLSLTDVQRLSVSQKNPPYI